MSPAAALNLEHESNWTQRRRTSRGKSMMRAVGRLLIAVTCLTNPVLGAEKMKAKAPKASPVPSFSPAKQPVVIGEFPVGVIIITFKETALAGDLRQAISTLERVTDTNLEADPTGNKKSSEYSTIVNQEEYFKIYSNGIAWPKIAVMTEEGHFYQDPNFYGYYCEYHSWRNPMGWKERKEGDERVGKMNQNAIRHANKYYRGTKPRFICYNYVTTRPTSQSENVTEALLKFYPNESTDSDRRRAARSRKDKKGELPLDEFDPWDHYAPVCKWGEPAWPNSKIQINDFAGGVFAHEVGHCLGAPDVYRIGRFNDGIGGAASLLAYGPTANAFSRYYHHAYIKEQNHPTIQTSGTYTLHPRHIDPKSDQAVGYLIPSNHPHYLYHVEYVHKENDSVGVGPSHEGMLISVVNLGLLSYLGSPDYFYVYRPNDPFFRGNGDTEKCLFGKDHRRTEFNMATEPSSRLPNLLDGGVSFKSIEENGETLTFEVVINRNPITGSAYTHSMLPQIRLDEISDVQPTSFTMDCTIKFRGEPLKTNYGFCWSTTKNPTVRDGTYVLAHRECYRGHAMNLTPNSTYYVRAFATNGLGVRYSDEEKIVKTPDTTNQPASIGPLFTDSFSNNDYLFKRYSNSSSEWFMDYSPTCALAKLIAYYRPAKFNSVSSGPSKSAEVDFNQLSWNPGDGDFPMRLEEIDGFFQSVLNQIRQFKLHEMQFEETKHEKELIDHIVKITSFRSKPILHTLGPDHVKQVTELIRGDLTKSRPVLIVFSNKDKVVAEPSRWALIDGISSSGHFHVDFPRNTIPSADEGLKEINTGDYPLEALMLSNYKVMVVTSCFTK